VDPFAIHLMIPIIAIDDDIGSLSIARAVPERGRRFPASIERAIGTTTYDRKLNRGTFKSFVEASE
jgi:hypothetical protein